MARVLLERLSLGYYRKSIYFIHIRANDRVRVGVGARASARSEVDYCYRTFSNPPTAGVQAMFTWVLVQLLGPGHCNVES